MLKIASHSQLSLYSPYHDQQIELLDINKQEIFNWNVTTKDRGCFGSIFPNVKFEYLSSIYVNEVYNGIMKSKRHSLYEHELIDLKNLFMGNICTEQCLIKIEEIIKYDVLKKRKFYTKFNHINWKLTLDPRDKIDEILSTDSHIEKIKKLYLAEGYIEFSYRKNSLKENWKNKKISYNQYIEQNLKLFNEVFDVFDLY